MNTDPNASINSLMSSLGIDMSASSGAYDPAVAILLLGGAFVGIVLWVLNIIGRWATISKCGGHGWAAIIPVYSDYEMANANDCPIGLTVAVTALSACTVLLGCLQVYGLGMYDLSRLISFALFVVLCVVYYYVARNFDRGVGYTIGLVLLPFIFFLILGCGSSQPATRKPNASFTRGV